MVRRPGYYLLCRPRRFGKSLFLTTAEAFFEGKCELFEGLAISRYDYDWEPSPVLHLNLVNTDASTPETLKELRPPVQTLGGEVSDDRYR